MAAAAWMPPVPRPLIANGSWSYALREHPRLLGTRSHLRSLAAAKTEVWEEIRSMNSLIATGVVHAVEGVAEDRIRPLIAQAMENVARGATNVHQDTWIWLEQVILTYDFFHESISCEDREAMIIWMNAHLDSFTDDENAFHNSTLSKILCYLRIAYGTWGENPAAEDFRAHALERLYEGRIVPVLREFGAEGGFTECGWYCRHCLWHLVQAFELARRLDGYDGYRAAPEFFYRRMAYEMLQPYPGLLPNGSERYAGEGDGNYRYSNNMEFPRLMRTVIAQYFRGSELSRYVASRRRRGSNADIRLLDFLYEEEPDEPLAMSAFPLAHCASGIGKVFARGDWSDDATWLRFECGDWWNQHQHFEAGNFEIFRREPLATESGEYTDWDSPHALNWLIRTVAHNCILVYQPDETFRNVRNRQGLPCANDGGQANDVFYVATLDQWKARREQFARGRIMAYRDRPEFMYVAGDCTKAYAQSKVSLCLRQIVFLRPHTIVILDRVVSTRPEYEKTWLLHCRNEPEIADRGITISNGAGRLYVQGLLPQDVTIRKIEGYSLREQTFRPVSDRLSAVAPRWRIDVQPSSADTRDVFLHVLSTEEMPAWQIVERNGHLGVRGDRWEVLLAGEGDGIVTLSGTTWSL
jgi:hypothetical protein